METALDDYFCDAELATELGVKQRTTKGGVISAAGLR